LLLQLPHDDRAFHLYRTFNERLGLIEAAIVKQDITQSLQIKDDESVIPADWLAATAFWK
jgi:hypothetical protein